MIRALTTIVDGRNDGEGWSRDRAFQYGDGLFETMLVRNARIRFEAFHQARMLRGCNRLAIHVDQAAIWRQAQLLARQHGDALLKLQVTRGDATARGYTPAGDEQPRVVFAVWSAPDAAELPAEIRAVTLSSRLGENPDLAGIKHCNRLEQVLGRASLKGTGAFEGLMGSSSGMLISGTMSNVFLELDGELVTPGLERCGIEGVLRAVALREARRMGLAVRIADIPMSAIARCSSMALSNARIGLLSVQMLDGLRLQHSKPLQDLAQRINSLDD
jgi:4-amino-4-deoxychorismate lyase